MYKKVTTDKSAITDNGVEFTPVATLEDEFGGKCQIAIDDNCYVVYLKQIIILDTVYKKTPYIFPEAFEVLKTLPSISRK